MPELPQYEANRADRGLQTNNTGMEAYAQEGRRVGVFYHQIGEQVGSDVKQLGDQWEDHQTFQQQSQGLASMAAMQNTHTQAFEQSLKDPSVNKEDPAFMKNAMDAYDQDQQKWLEGFTTQKGKMWATELATRDREDFQKYAIGQTSHAVGLATLDQNDQAKNQYGQAAFADPASALDKAERYSDFAKGTLNSGAMDFQTAAAIEPHIREGAAGIAMQGALGAIMNSSDPVKALDTYMSDPRAQELLGDKAGELQERAQTQARSVDQQQKAAQIQQRQQTEDQGKGVYVQITNAANAYIRAGKPVPPQLMQQGSAWAQVYGSLLPAENSTMQSMFDRSITDANGMTFQQNDTRTYDALSARVTVPQGQPGALSQHDLDQAFFQQKSISKDAYTQLSEAIKRGADNPAVNEGWKTLSQWMDTNVKAQLYNKGATTGNDLSTLGGLSSNAVNPNAEAAWGEANREAHDIYLANLQAGLSPGDAVKRMTDPGSPHNIAGTRMMFWKEGRDAPNALQFFSQNAGTADYDVKGGAPSATPKMNPGETAAAYLQRIGL